jgi:hypothetical protein
MTMKRTLSFLFCLTVVLSFEVRAFAGTSVEGAVAEHVYSALNVSEEPLTDFITFKAVGGLVCLNTQDSSSHARSFKCTTQSPLNSAAIYAALNVYETTPYPESCGIATLVKSVDGFECAKVQGGAPGATASYYCQFK